MKKIEKARRIIDRVFYVVIIGFSMYCLGVFVWLVSKLIGEVNLPNTHVIDGLTIGIFVWVLVLCLFSLVDYILKKRQIFLYKKFGGSGK